MDFLDHKVASAQREQVGLSAFRTFEVALAGIELLTAVVAANDAGDDLHLQLHVFIFGFVGSRGEALLNEFRDDAGNLADLQNYCFNVCELFLDHYLVERFKHGA